MACLDMGVFIQKLHEYIQNGPPEERKEKDEFTSRFLSVYDVLRRTLCTKGFSRTVDLSKFSYEDLDWVITQIESVPHAEVGVYEDEIDEVDVFRDRALKIAESGLIRLEDMLRNRSARPVEDYF